MADSSTTAREGGISTIFTVARLGMLSSARQYTLESRKVTTTTSSTITVNLIAVSAIAISSQQLDGCELDDSQGGGTITLFTATVAEVLSSARQYTLESRKVITITSLTTVSLIAVSTIAISSSQQLDGLQLDDSRQGGGDRHHLHHD